MKGNQMLVNISCEGMYNEHGAWVARKIKATRGAEYYEIYRDGDSYYVESFLLFDEVPQVSHELTMQEAWNGLAEAFGLVTHYDITGAVR